MDFTQIFESLLTTLGEGLLNLLAGLALLVLFWLLALIAAAIVRNLLGRTSWDERLSEAISGDGEGAAIRLDRWISAIVFWVIFLFGLIAFLQRINLEAVSAPLEAVLHEVSDFIPNLVLALVLLAVAWIIASVLKFLIIKVANGFKLDERLSSSADLEEGQVSVTNSIATAVYWLIFLLFLPAILSQLNIGGLVEPVQNMIDSMLGAIPNVFSAALVLVIGWFVARILRQVLENLLVAAGVDRFGERVGLTGAQALSKIVGTVVYAVVMITTLIAALGELGVDALSGPATAMLTTVLEAIPAIFGALLILGLAYLVARLVAGLITSLLTGIGLNKVPGLLGFEIEEKEGRRTLSEVVGMLVVVAVMLFAATEAANLMGFELVAVSIIGFTAFFGDVLLGLVILAIGLYLANLAKSVVLSAGGSNSAFVANLARVVIIVFAAAMALRQTGIADEIVNLAFGIMLAAVGLAAALAFGLGSREVAGREMDRWVGSMRSTGDEESE